MTIPASLLWEKRRGIFESPPLFSADPIRSEPESAEQFAARLEAKSQLEEQTKDLSSYSQKRFLRIRDSLGRIRCFQEGKPVVCGREQDPEVMPRFQEVEEQKFPQQATPEDQSGQPIQSMPTEDVAQQQMSEPTELTCEDIDPNSNVLLYEYDEQELLAERQWQEQFLGWLVNLQQQGGMVQIDAASPATRFITGLMNEAADEQWITQIAGAIQPTGSVADDVLAQVCGDVKGSALAGLFGTVIGEMAQVIIDCVTAELEEQIQQEENAPVDLNLEDVLDLHWAELTPEGRKIRLQHAAERRDDIRRRIAERKPNSVVINTGPDEALVHIHEEKQLGSVYDAGQWLARRWEELEHTYSRRDAFAMALAMLALQYQFLPGTLYTIVIAAEVARGLQGFARMYFSGWEMQRIALRKDMSWLDPNRGATLVAPAAQATRIGLHRNRRVVTKGVQLVS